MSATVTRRSSWLPLVLLAALLGCDQPTANLIPDEDAPPGYPRTLETPTGETVLVLRPPQRVLPANAAAFEFLCELIGPDRVAALPSTVREYSRGADAEGWDALQRFAKLEGERLLHIAPDCVLASQWQEISGIEVLQNAQIPIFEIPDVVDFEVVLRVLRFLGEVLDESERAAKLVAELEQRSEAVFDPNRARWRAMVYTNFGSGGWTAGSGTTADVMLRMTGLRNAAAEEGLRDNCRLEIERLLELDPDILMIASAEDGGDYAPTLRTLRERPELKELRALRNDRIVQIPTALFGTTSHRLLEAAELLAAAVDRF